MVKKIHIVEVIEYVYEPVLNDEEYLAENIKTIEEALTFDRKSVNEGDVTPLCLADDFDLVGRTWRIIDEP